VAVTLVQSFEVPDGREEEFKAGWFNPDFSYRVDF
jgi:hypothetical protein